LGNVFPTHGFACNVRGRVGAETCTEPSSITNPAVRTVSAAKTVVAKRVVFFMVTKKRY
jgi:hypothetical protein